MCCGGPCAGGILYVVERLASFAALTAVVMCIFVTMGITLGLGIGLGYNYCFVDLKVVKESSGKEEPPPALRDRNNKDEEQLDTPSYRRSHATSPPTPPSRTVPMPGIKHTMAIPLHGDFDFPSLLAKLRARNRNVTIELIT